MSDKIQWYMIAFWIFLSLSVSHFALAAPVAVGEIVEVRSNPVEVLYDVMAGDKRMDPNDKNQPSTNDVHLPDGVSGPGDAPGVVQEGVNAEGVKEEGASGWGWGWDPNKFSELPSDLEELLESIKEPDDEGVKEEGVSGWGLGWDPDKFPELPPNLEELLWGIKGPDSSHSSPPKEESDGGGGDHAMESSQGSAEDISPGPQPEHPPTPDLTTSLKEWLKRPRRRTQGLQAL